MTEFPAVLFEHGAFILTLVPVRTHVGEVVSPVKYIGSVISITEVE